MRQVQRFAVVGLANTLVDFVLFQALTKLFGIPLSHVWIAKAVSGTVALAGSFFLNRRWVFRATRGRRLVGGQAARFVLATVIGVYVIQTLLTQFFATTVPEPGELLFRVARDLGLAGIVSEVFMIKTVAFALATAASMSWNYVAYRWWVFNGRAARGPGVP